MESSYFHSVSIENECSEEKDRKNFICHSCVQLFASECPELQLCWPRGLRVHVLVLAQPMAGLAKDTASRAAHLQGPLIEMQHMPGEGSAILFLLSVHV